MWKIEKYIKDHQEQLNEDQLLDGHEDRFIMRLQKADISINKTQSRGLWFKVAATLILLVSVVWLSLEPFKSSQASALNKVTAIEIPDELTEVLSYYDGQIENDVQELVTSSQENKSSAIINDAARKQIDKLDAQLMNIEKEYTKNPGNEAVKAAMVNTQRKKAEIVSSLNITSQAAAQGYRVGEPYTQF
jgi:hypothetical protein